MRKLSNDEQTAWNNVISSVKPLDCPQMGSQDINKQDSILVAKTDSGSYLTLPRVKIPSIKRISVNPILDLHGMTIEEAFTASLEHISNMRNKFKFITIITGKSGPIKLEFPRWLENNPNVKSIKLNDNGGSWKICLKNNI